MEDNPTPAQAFDQAAPVREHGFCCDFCGDRVPRVRRVVLDRGYERLQTRHLVRYACESCSDEKERDRVGLSRG